jgi:hypothetical protein
MPTLWAYLTVAGQSRRGYGRTGFMAGNGDGYKWRMA